MIGDVLTLLKDQLNLHMRSISGASPDETIEDKVVFVETGQNDQVTFKTGAISLIIFRMEQDNLLRSADPFVRVNSNGEARQTYPDVLLNVYVLFVARFKDYAQGLHFLSSLIQYFQGHPRIDHQNTPAMSDMLNAIEIELLNMSMAEQNEVWGTLRTAYLPSVAYKIKQVVFRGEDLRPLVPITEEQRRL